MNCRRYGVHVMGLDKNRKICGLMFADDVVLLAPSTTRLHKSLQSVQRWAKIFEMKFGVQKCGIMGIGEEAHRRVVNNQDLWRLNGELIPVVTEYLYLGVLINGTLDLDVVAKDRAMKGRKALNAIRPVLISRSIPTIVKSRLVNAVLIPTLSYSGEIWGMQETRAKYGQKVISEAMRLMAGLKITSSCTSTATLALEFGIIPLAAITSAARTRAYLKYPTLRTYIADLVQAPMSNRKKTWVSGTPLWLRRYHNDALLCGSPTTAADLVKSRLCDKLSRGGITSERYRECQLSQSVQYLSVAYQYPNIVKGIWWLTRMRVSAFWTAVAFERIGWLPNRYRNRCPFCNMVGTGETIEHLLMVCPQWADHRRQYLGSLINIGANYYNLLGGSKYNGGLTSDQVRTSWLLPKENEHRDEGNSQTGNENVVDNRSPGFVQVAMYLQQVMPIRLRRLAVLLKTPRTDADDNGMVALTEGSDHYAEDANDEEIAVGIRWGPATTT